MGNASQPPSPKKKKNNPLLVSSAFNQVLNITPSNVFPPDQEGRTLRTQHFTKPTVHCERLELPKLDLEAKRPLKRCGAHSRIAAAGPMQPPRL